MRFILYAIFGLATALGAGSKPWDRAERLNADTVLIGIGCEGPESVVLGDEEDEFPACERIERHYMPKEPVASGSDK